MSDTLSNRPAGSPNQDQTVVDPVQTRLLSSDLSRRGFLKLFGASAGALALGGLFNLGSLQSRELDVAVVGAGIAGLYTAWSLLTRDSRASRILAQRLDGNGGPLRVGL